MLSRKNAVSAEYSFQTLGIARQRSSKQSHYQAFHLWNYAFVPRAMTLQPARHHAKRNQLAATLTCNLSMYSLNCCRVHLKKVTKAWNLAISAHIEESTMVSNPSLVLWMELFDRWTKGSKVSKL